MIWQIIAKVLAHPKIANMIIKHAYKTPYVHLQGYMHRWWLFNPYGGTPENRKGAKYNWLPSIRVHHILREDWDQPMHDHSWNARTIILKGWYTEIRKTETGTINISRCAGDTATLNFGEYHKVIAVSDGGVWTLFFTWKHQGVWGFLVDGYKVPFYEYLKGKVR